MDKQYVVSLVLIEVNDDPEQPDKMAKSIYSKDLGAVVEISGHALSLGRVSKEQAINMFNGYSKQHELLKKQ